MKGNSTGFTGNVVVNGGTFRVEATAGTSNFNATDITVNYGGTFVFGIATVNNPNIPNETCVTANTGSVASCIAVGATGTLEFNRTDTVSFGNSISSIG